MSLRWGLCALPVVALSACSLLPAGFAGLLGSDAFPPPPPDQGVQLHVGPFAVPEHLEVQRNYYVKLPVDRAVEIARVEFHFGQGSHHCSVFKSDTEDVADHLEDTFKAVPYNAYDMVAASQTELGRIDFPNGYTLALKPRQQLLVQTHYVNALSQTTPGNLGDVRINLWYAKPGGSKGHVGMLFAVNKLLAIPPHATDFVATKSVTFPAKLFPNGTKLFAMTGHFHSRGKRFEVFRYDHDVVGEKIYENTTWSEPPYKTYGTPIDVAPDAKFLYKCTFANESDATISFGPRVETQEHANAFMYFYPAPSDGRAFYDMDGLVFKGGSW